MSIPYIKDKSKQRRSWSGLPNSFFFIHKDRLGRNNFQYIIYTFRKQALLILTLFLSQM